MFKHFAHLSSVLGFDFFAVLEICEAESWYNVLLGLLPELRSAGPDPSVGEMAS